MEELANVAAVSEMLLGVELSAARLELAAAVRELASEERVCWSL